MKRILCLIVGGAALFAVGYWAGTARAPSEGSGSKAGPVATAAGKAGNPAAKNPDVATLEKTVRPFQPGRPFPPGGAKAWLLAMALQLGREGLDDFPVEAIDLAQTFMTMDEAAAREAAEALKEIMAMIEAGDPAFKGLREADDLAGGAFLITAFRLSQLNPQAAMALLKDSPKGIPDELTAVIFARLASQNPAQAESMLAGLEEEHRKEALEGIIHGLAGKDPVAALALAEKYPDEISRNDRNEIIERMMRSDPQQGIAAAARISETEKDSGALRNAFKEWIEHDQSAAMAWAENYAGPGKLAVQAHLLEQRANEDPQGAMEDFARLQQNAADSRELTGAAGIIADKLSENDIASAHTWAAALPDGQPKDAALSSLASNWVRKDPAAASEWIASLPAGSVKDDAANNLAQAITKRDPAAAFEWARNIQNRDQRTNAIQNVMEEWRGQDPDAAKAALQSLPPDVRKSIGERE
jgi:hypothetical protein